MVRESEALTASNTAMNLTICANYGGRWDIMQAVEKMLAAKPGARRLQRTTWRRHLRSTFGPEPDLFIRTGGEAHQQFHAVAAGLLRAVFHRQAVA